ncbi:hypothetical protein AB0H43_26255 [Hamadaea sp. NPDC050747]|uniref:hypothetical protein n=1 Tax=Hamadaea sp. NPDC050747 TaxID=3155789 RepID=UPI0033DBE88B
MARVRVTVCLPPTDGTDLRTRLATALAPFEVGVGRSWGREQWDWWTIRGGSDRTGFWIADGADEALLIHDDPYETEEASPSKPGRCAGGPKHLLDLGRPRLDAARHAAHAWDTWHRLAPSLPPVQTLAQIEQWPEHAEDDRLVLEPLRLPNTVGNIRAYQAYLAQPLIRAAQEWPAWHEIERGPEDFVYYMAMSRDDYIDLAVGQTDRKSDILTPDGWWASWDQRPVHGACDAFETCTHTAPIPDRTTPAELTHYLEQLPDDTLLVQLKAHG